MEEPFIVAKDPEREMVRGIRQRDSHCLELLIARYAAELYALVSHILGGLGTPQDTEEVVGDVFVAVWRAIEQFDAQRGTLAKWMRMRAKYMALDRRRKRRREIEARVEKDASVFSDHAVETALDRIERKEVLERALADLSELDRAIVYRRYFAEQSIKEIAEAVALTQRSVENRLWRARRTLREKMRASEREEQVNVPESL